MNRSKFLQSTTQWYLLEPSPEVVAYRKLPWYLKLKERFFRTMVVCERCKTRYWKYKEHHPLDCNYTYKFTFQDQWGDDNE